MRRTVLFFGVVLLTGLGVAFAQQDTKDKSKQADADKKNPVKPTTDGLAEARKLYGYHCAMCHGQNGDGKGDLAEQMKLNLSDWRNPDKLSKYTDGALFYIITNGRGEEGRWRRRSHQGRNSVESGEFGAVVWKKDGRDCYKTVGPRDRLR